MFNDILKTQLLLTNVITPEDWDVMEEHIQYDFLYDNHFAELKEAELFNERLAMVAVAEPYVGKYFSQDYLRRKVLRQTDEEIIEQDKIMEKEIKDGTIPDPSIPTDPETGMPLEDLMNMQARVNGNGDPGGRAEAEDSATKADTDTVELEAPTGNTSKPKGGII